MPLDIEKTEISKKIYIPLDNIFNILDRRELNENLGNELVSEFKTAKFEVRTGDLSIKPAYYKQISIVVYMNDKENIIAELIFCHNELNDLWTGELHDIIHDKGIIEGFTKYIKLTKNQFIDDVELLLGLFYVNFEYLTHEPKSKKFNIGDFVFVGTYNRADSDLNKYYGVVKEVTLVNNEWLYSIKLSYTTDLTLVIGTTYNVPEKDIHDGEKALRNLKKQANKILDKVLNKTI